MTARITAQSGSIQQTVSVCLILHSKELLVTLCRYAVQMI